MRVLLVTEFYPPFVGGLAHHVRSLALNLTKRGHEVQVLTTDSPKLVIENDERIRVTRTPHSLSYFAFVFRDRGVSYVPPIPDFSLLRTLAKSVHGFHPDVVHAHGWSMITVAALKSIKSRLPVVITLHDHGFFCPNRTCFNENRGSVCSQRKPVLFSCMQCAALFYGASKALAVTLSLSAFRKLLNKVNKVIAVSGYIGNVAMESGLHNVMTIPNFIDFGEFKKDKVVQQAHSENRSVDLLFVGGLTSYKGIGVLLKAYKAIKKDSSHPLNLVLIGKPSLNSQVSILDPEIEIRQNMSHRFVLSCMRNAKLVVVPSISPETSSMVALEAMAIKKAVIASRIGGLNEVVQDQKTGLLVPPNDSSKLANAIKYLLERPQITERMGRAGYNRVVECFSAEKIVPQVENVYRDLIK